jgi:hypothetical protein
MTKFACPYFSNEVELTEERERHIENNHPDLLPEHRARIAETLESPDQIRISVRFKNARLFSRWFPDVRAGKFIAVVVVSENDQVERHWIITAYITRKLSGGKIEWRRN